MGITSPPLLLKVSSYRFFSRPRQKRSASVKLSAVCAVVWWSKVFHPLLPVRGRISSKITQAFHQRLWQNTIFLSSLLRILRYHQSIQLWFGTRLRTGTLGAGAGGISVLSTAHFTVSGKYRRVGIVEPSRQNQSRSSPLASSMVRNKSAGVGCLKAQRLAYSLNT